MEKNEMNGRRLRDVLKDTSAKLSPEEIKSIGRSYQQMRQWYREIAESYQSSLLKGLNIAGRAAAEMAETVRKFRKTTVPRYIQAINTLKDYGWALSPQMEMSDFLDFADDDSDVDVRMSTFYSENGHGLLLDELNYLQGNLPNEFEPVLNEIKRNVSDPNSSNVLCFGALYSILDYLFVRAVGKEFANKRYTASQTRIQDVLDKIGEPDNRSEYFGYWLRANLILLYEQYQNQVLTQPSALIYVTRHSVEHGRVDYSKLTDLQLFKLVCLASSFSEIGSDLGDFVELSDL